MVMVSLLRRVSLVITLDVIDLAADEFISDNPHRGGYHGMHVPGAGACLLGDDALKHEAHRECANLCICIKAPALIPPP